jgi:hypothetical protein
MFYYYIAIGLSVLLFVSTAWIVLLTRKHSDIKRKLEFLIEVVYRLQGGDDND